MHFALHSQSIRQKSAEKSTIMFWRNSLLIVFEAVKQNLTTRQAAEMYGILLKNKATDAMADDDNGRKRSDRQQTIRNP